MTDPIYESGEWTLGCRTHLDRDWRHIVAAYMGVRTAATVELAKPPNANWLVDVTRYQALFSPSPSDNGVRGRLDA